MDALKVKKLYFSYNGSAVALYEDFSLVIEKEKVTAIMGPSGCGKSTLGKIIGEQLTPQGGEIVWDDFFEAPFDRFYVDQDPHKVIFPQQKVEKNVRHPLELERKNSEELIDAKVGDTLSNFGLEALADQFPKDLSGGEKSRLALARVLAREPKAIILDECLSGLDLHTRDIILKILEDRAGSEGATTVFITHTVNEVLRIAHRCIVLGKHPVEVIADFSIPLPIPRDESSKEYAAFLDKLIAILKDDI